MLLTVCVAVQSSSHFHLHLQTCISVHCPLRSTHGLHHRHLSRCSVLCFFLLTLHLPFHSIFCLFSCFSSIFIYVFRSLPYSCLSPSNPTQLVPFHSNSNLELGKNDGTALFAQDASWYELPDTRGDDSGNYLVYRSFNIPSKYLAHLANRAGADRLVLQLPDALGKNDYSFRKVYPALGAQGLPCDGVKTYQDEVFRLSFEEGYGSVTADSSFGAASVAVEGAVDWVAGALGFGLYFEANGDNGVERLLVSDFWTSPDSDFTLSLWVRPEVGYTTAVDRQTPQGIINLRGNQRYVIYPSHGSSFKSGSVAGIGVAVGTNGVGVYGHSSSFLPCLLFHATDISSSDWTHLAVVVSKDQPTLYINGELAKVGLTSAKPLTFFPTALGSAGAGGYGAPYGGDLDEVRAYDRTLAADEVQALYNSVADTQAERCVSAQEGTVAELTCADGMVIYDIGFASYGTPTGKCGAFEPNDACHSEVSHLQVSAQCLGKASCRVAASNNGFMDPCFGSQKTLTVQYTVRKLTGVVQLALGQGGGRAREAWS